MSNLERSTVAILAAASIMIGAYALGANSLERVSRISGLYDRIAFSTSTYTEPQLARAIFDRDIRTVWADRGIVQSPGRYHLPADMGSSLPDPRSLHLTVEIGLSHFPGRPPRANKIQELVVWSGDQSSPAAFRKRARPKKIHLVFFQQALVDMDREYRFPGEPKPWMSRAVVLQDTPAPQRIALGFLPSLPASPRFPIHVSQIWLRIIVETYYPGAAERDLTAISELDLLEPHATLPRMPGDRTRWLLLHPSAQ